MSDEPRAYVVEHGGSKLWLQRDRLGKWLVTQELQVPERFLTLKGEWTKGATRDVRYDEQTAMGLALWILTKDDHG